MAYDIFISHTSQEVDLAEALKRQIQEDFADFEVFISSDDSSIGSNQEWMNQIKAALLEVKLMVVLCSVDSLKRPWISFEAGAAWIKQIDMMPICHGGLVAGSLPSSYSAFQSGGINALGVRRLYANITRIFDKKARDEQKIVSAVHALEKAEKVVMRKKVTAKRLSEANAVGAICFRQDTADADIEILLVRTSSRDRWIFPKGTITPGSDHLATLGRELEEEAGVVGDVNAGEPIFLTYRKGDGTQKNLVLYPVRVISFGPPKEAGRLPTWISASKVLKKLKEGRERDDSFDALATAFNFFVATRK